MIEDLRRRWPCPFCGEHDAVPRRGTLCPGCEQATRQRSSEATRWEQPPLPDASPPVPGRSWQDIHVTGDRL